MIASLRRCLSLQPISLDLEQAILRIIVTTAVIIYLVLVGKLIDALSLTLAFLYFSTAIFILVMVIHGPEESLLRRIFGMISDLGGATYILANFGEAGAPAVFVYFWVTIGNGLRWGIQYLYLAMILSIAGMTVAFVFSQYWRANPYLYVGITLSLLIVPLFVSRLLRRLNELIEREKIASQYKSQFLANMSHELRTPLHGVIGTTDLLLASKLDPAQMEHVRTINASADSLLSVVNDVLDISKIEAGKQQLRREPIDLPALVRDTVQVVIQEASRKGLVLAIHTESEVPTTLYSDASAIRKVLLNLLSNAVKFTSTGSIHVRVKVSLSPVISDEPQIRIEVADTGIGIPRSLQSKIFESFSQADETITREFGGTGLGMAISHQLIKMLNGEIGVQSEPSKGSTVWFEIPVGTNTDHPRPCANSRRYRILIVASTGDPFVNEIRLTLNDTDKYSLHTIHERHEPYVPEDYDAVLVSDQLPSALFDTMLSLFTSTSDYVSRAGLIWTGASFPSNIPAASICLLRRPADEQRIVNALRWTAKPPQQNLVGLKRIANSPLRKILIADDQKSSRMILASIVEHGGYRTQTVGDGLEALSALDKDHFDIAIIDYHMPGESGVSIIHRYRKAHPKSNVRFLVLTADATPGAKQECDLAGADYLTKPVRGAVLLQKLEALTSGIAECNTQSLNLQRIRELRAYYPSRMAFVDTLHEFLQDADLRLNRMREALRSDKWDVVQEHAHALKGSSQFIGAQQLVGWCQNIETQEMGLDESTIDTAAIELERFKNEVVRAIGG